MTAAADSSPRSELDVRSLVRTLFAFKWLILACVVVVGAGVAFWTLQQPRIYEAKTVIEFDPNPVRPLGDDVEDVADPTGGFWSAREFMATQNRVLASRSVAEGVVRRLGLHEDPGFFGVPSAGFEPRDVTTTATHLLDGMVTVNPVKDTRLVEIRVRGRNPEQAAAIADAFASVYIEKTLEDRMGSTVSALEWLGGQLDTLGRELEESELALHQFKQDHNVLSVSMEDRQNLVAGEIESFNTALTDARKRRIEVAARVARLQQAMGQDPLAASGTVFDERSALNALRESLRAKVAERERMSATRGANHPDRRALDEEIEALREQLAQEVETIVRNAESDLREIRSVESGLRQAVEEAHTAGLELNLREIEYQRLNRARENKAKLYQVVLERTTETDLTRMFVARHVRIVDAALVPRWPVAPNRTVNVLVGLLAGLIFGVALAFGLRFLDRRLRGPDTVEELGVTVLGVVPTVATEASPTDKRKRRRAPAPGSDLVVFDQPMSTAAECIRTVRTNLTFMAAAESRSKVWVVTSSQPQEGKTTIASNLAASMAQSGKSVLLIDTDLRRPRVHSSFALSREHGVSTFLAGEATFDSAAQSSRVPGLDVMTSGPVPPNPAELLHGPAFARLVAAARERYDLVIFDSPPLGAVTDAAIIAPQVDGVIVVVRASQTTRDALRSTLRQLKDVHARVLGAVVNGFVFNADGYYGKGYYYRRYGEYYASDNEGEARPDSEAAE
jgi:capsular exopolysaccharide synthesis family protein